MVRDSLWTCMVVPGRGVHSTRPSWPPLPRTRHHEWTTRCNRYQFS
jgi:hypothetical protein